MQKLLMIAALGEAGTGIVLLAYPPIVISLLFGLEIVGAGVMMSRIAGISLIALGAACWPSGGDTNRAYVGMLIYSTLAMVYLVVVGITGRVGILLWPGVIAHALLSVLLIRGALVTTKGAHQPE